MSGTIYIWPLFINKFKKSVCQLFSDRQQRGVYNHLKNGLVNICFFNAWIIDGNILIACSLTVNCSFVNKVLQLIMLISLSGREAFSERMVFHMDWLYRALSSLYMMGALSFFICFLQADLSPLLNFVRKENLQNT